MKSTRTLFFILIYILFGNIKCSLYQGHETPITENDPGSRLVLKPMVKYPIILNPFQVILTIWDDEFQNVVKPVKSN